MEQEKLSILEVCNCPHCVELRRQQERAEQLQATKKPPMSECIGGLIVPSLCPLPVAFRYKLILYSSII